MGGSWHGAIGQPRMVGACHRAPTAHGWELVPSGSSVWWELLPSGSNARGELSPSGSSAWWEVLPSGTYRAWVEESSEPTTHTNLDPGNSGFFSYPTCPINDFCRVLPCNPGVPRCVLPCRPPACSSEQVVTPRSLILWGSAAQTVCPSVFFRTDPRRVLPRKPRHVLPSRSSAPWCVLSKSGEPWCVLPHRPLACPSE